MIPFLFFKKMKYVHVCVCFYMHRKKPETPDIKSINISFRNVIEGKEEKRRETLPLFSHSSVMFEFVFYNKYYFIIKKKKVNRKDTLNCPFGSQIYEK